MSRCTILLAGLALIVSGCVVPSETGGITASASPNASLDSLARAIDLASAEDKKAQPALASQSGVLGADIGYEFHKPPRAQHITKLQFLFACVGQGSATVESRSRNNGEKVVETVDCAAHNPVISLLVEVGPGDLPGFVAKVSPGSTGHYAFNYLRCVYWIDPSKDPLGVNQEG